MQSRSLSVRPRESGDPERKAGIRVPGSPLSRGRTERVDPPERISLGRCLASACGGAQLLALGLEDVVEAVLGELDAGREPEIAGLLHVVKDPAQRERAAGPADDVRVHGERDVLRTLGTAL